MQTGSPCSAAGWATLSLLSTLFSLRGPVLRAGCSWKGILAAGGDKPLPNAGRPGSPFGVSLIKIAGGVAPASLTFRIRFPMDQTDFRVRHVLESCFAGIARQTRTTSGACRLISRWGPPAASPRCRRARRAQDRSLRRDWGRETFSGFSHRQFLPDYNFLGLIKKCSIYRCPLPNLSSETVNKSVIRVVIF